MASLGDLFITVGAKIDGFRGAMAEVKSSLQSTAADVKTFGAGMTAAVSLPIMGVGVAALKVAGDLEQTSVAFKSLLGSSMASAAHLKELKDFALKTPFQFMELAQASKRLQTFGFDAKNVIPILKSVGDAAAMSGLGAEGINRITTALGQMHGKGRVMSQEMNQLTEAMIPAWEILAKTLNTTVADAMKKVEAGAVSSAVAIPALLAGMNAKFKNAMEEQAKTLLGQWSNIRDKIFFALADIGTALAPAAKDAMQNVFSPMLEMLTGLAKGFSELPPQVRNTIIALTAFLALLGPLTFAVGGLISAITKLSLGLLALGPILANVTTAIRFGLIGALTGAELAAFGAAALLGVGIAMALSRAFSEEIARQSPTWAKLFNWHPEDASFIPQGTSESRIGHRQKGPGDFRGPSESIAGHRAGASSVVAAVLGAKEIGAAFSNLGVKNLALELAEAEAAFRLLTAAGKLNAGQSQEAQDHIALLRFELERLTAGLSATREKLNRVPFAEKSREGALLTAQIDALSERQRKMTKDIAESGLKVDEFFIKQMGEARESLERFNTIAPPAATWEAPIKDAGKALKEIVELMPPLAPIVYDLAEAFKFFGIQSASGLEMLAAEAEKNFGLIRKSGEGSAIDIARAWVKSSQARIDADLAAGAISQATYKDLSESLDRTGNDIKRASGEMQGATKKGIDFGRQVSTVFNDLGRSLTDVIFGTKRWGDAFKDIGKSIVRIILEDIIGVGIKALMGALSGLLSHLGGVGKALGGLLGGGASAAGSAIGGAASAGGSAASGVAGIAGQAVGMGVQGVMGIVTGAVSAVSGVIGNFQFAGMNKSLDLIVNHTLRIYNDIANLRIDHWHQFNETYNRLWEIQKVLMAGAGGVSIDLRNSTFGAGVNQQAIEAMFQAAFLKAQAARG